MPLAAASSPRAETAGSLIFEAPRRRFRLSVIGRIDLNTVKLLDEPDGGPIIAAVDRPPSFVEEGDARIERESNPHGPGWTLPVRPHRIRPCDGAPQVRHRHVSDPCSRRVANDLEVAQQIFFERRSGVEHRHNSLAEVN